MPGAIVGDYRVDATPAPTGLVGGATLHAATDVIRGTPVTIRWYPPPPPAQRAALERLRADVGAVRAIDHPHIETLHAVAVLPDGGCYVVAERMQAPRLTEALKRGELPLPRALLLLDQLASALAAAHAQGLVHEVITPNSVYLTATATAKPRVKLVDFGLRALQRPPPDFVSPEEARGEPVDARSDVYALGVLAFRLVVGELPFVDPDPEVVIGRHVLELPPTPRSRRAGIPLQLEQLILWMLEKDPAARPPLAEVRTEIAEIARAVAGAGGPGRRRRMIVAIGVAIGAIGVAVVLGLVVAGGVLSAPRGRTPATVTAAAPAASPEPVLAPPDAGSVATLAAPADAASAASADATLSVVVDSAIIDPLVRVDGTPVPVANGRARLAGLPAGAHDIAVSAPRYQPVRLTVQVAGGTAMEVPVTLVRIPRRRAATEAHDELPDDFHTMNPWR